MCSHFKRQGHPENDFSAPLETGRRENLAKNWRYVAIAFVAPKCT
jgi:hypothetical protein